MAVHMPEHVLSYESRSLVSRANEAAATTQDANRWINSEVCHAKTNVPLVGQFRAVQTFPASVVPWVILSQWNHFKYGA